MLSYIMVVITFLEHRLALLSLFWHSVWLHELVLIHTTYSYVFCYHYWRTPKHCENKSIDEATKLLTVSHK